MENNAVTNETIEAVCAISRGVIKDAQGVEKTVWVITFGREDDKRTSTMPGDFSEPALKEITDRLQELIATAMREDAERQCADDTCTPDERYLTVVSVIPLSFSHLSELRTIVSDMDPVTKTRPKGGFSRGRLARW